MKKETYIDIDICSFEIKRSKQQINIVNPNHIFSFFILIDLFCKYFVDVSIVMPHSCNSWINIIFICSLKVMEKRSHKLFIKKKIIFCFLLWKKNRMTVFSSKQRTDFFFFLLILRKNTWPSIPYEIF